MKCMLFLKKHPFYIKLAIIPLILLVLFFSFKFIEIKSCAIDLKSRLTGPCLDYPFGTDRLGRNLFYRIPAACLQTILICFKCLFLTLPVSFFLALFAGFFRGRLLFKTKNLLIILFIFLFLPGLFFYFTIKILKLNLYIIFPLFYLIEYFTLSILSDKLLLSSPFEVNEHSSKAGSFFSDLVLCLSNIWMLFPAFAFGMVVASRLEPSSDTLILISSILIWPVPIKTLHTAIKKTSENDSLKYAWASGASEFHLIFKNCIPMIKNHIEQACHQTLLMCLSISTVLAYLDIGETGRSSLTLGGILAEAYSYQTWWLIFIPSLFLALCSWLIILILKFFLKT